MDRARSETLSCLAAGPRPPARLLDRLRDRGIEARWAGDAEAVLEALGDDGDGRITPVLIHGETPGAVLRTLRQMADMRPDLVLVALATTEGPERRQALEAGAAELLTLGAAETETADGRDGVAGRIADLARHRELERELERTREELAAAEERFRGTVQRMADGVVVVGPEGSIRYVNPAAEELFQRTGPELVGEAFGAPLVVGETTEVDLMRASGAPVTAELRVRETIWKGERCLLASLRDITDRRRAEERARELIREQTARREAERSAERNRFLGDASRTLASSLDPGEILDRLVGLAARRVPAACVVEVLEDAALLGTRHVAGPSDGRLVAALETCGSPLFPSLMEELRETGAPRRVQPVTCEWLRASGCDEASAATLEGLAPAAVVGLPLEVEGELLGALSVVVEKGTIPPSERETDLLQELVHRAALALENARLYRRVQQADRAKSDFLDVISHELRTPLTAIVGYGGLLREGLGGPALSEDQLGYLDGIERNSDQLLAIIDQLLLFADTQAEREEVRWERESVAVLVGDVERVMAPLARRDGLDFDVTLPSTDDLEVRLDPPKVRQVLLHLLGNAVKFTDEGRVGLEVDLTDEEVAFHVRDSGIGIPEAQRKRIFRPFTQVEESTTRAVGGAGLGLSLVQDLVTLLEGEIEVESEVGRGSTFTVRLPRWGVGAEGDGASPDPS